MTVARSFVVALLACGCSSNGNGGTTGGGATNISVAKICSMIGALNCDDTEAQCLHDLGSRFDRETLAGCGSEFGALYDCEASQPFVCSSFSEGKQSLPTARCDAQEEATKGCMPFCQSGVTKDGVRFNCTGGRVGTLTATCDTNCHCTCTEGPRTGTTFTATSCGLTDVETLLLTNCR
jgi:hypothetical protein